MRGLSRCCGGAKWRRDGLEVGRACEGAAGALEAYIRDTCKSLKAKGFGVFWKTFKAMSCNELQLQLFSFRKPFRLDISTLRR
jgi:hypothetical protein